MYRMYRNRLKRVIPVVVALVTALVCAVGPLKAGPAEDQYRVAGHHYAQRRWQYAADEFRTFLTRHADHGLAVHARFFLAESLVQLNQYPQAREAFRHFLEQHADHEYARQALFRLGECAYLQGDSAVAREELTEFRRRFADDPLNAFALPYVADLELQAGEFAEAEATYGQALEKYPAGALADDCRFGLAHLADRRGDRITAERFWDFLALKQQSHYADDALLKLGIARHAQQQYASGAELLQRLAQEHPDSPLLWHARYWRGRCLAAENRWAEVRSTLGDLPAALPVDLAAALHLLDGEAAWHTQQPDLARTRLKEVVERWPATQWAADALRELLQMAWEQEDYREVSRLAEQFAALYPTSPHADAVHQTRLRALLKLGDYDAVTRLANTNPPQHGAAGSGSFPAPPSTGDTSTTDTSTNDTATGDPSTSDASTSDASTGDTAEETTGGGAVADGGAKQRGDSSTEQPSANPKTDGTETVPAPISGGATTEPATPESASPAVTPPAEQGTGDSPAATQPNGDNSAMPVAEHAAADPLPSGATPPAESLGEKSPPQVASEDPAAEPTVVASAPGDKAPGTAAPGGDPGPPGAPGAPGAPDAPGALGDSSDPEAEGRATTQRYYLALAQVGRGEYSEALETLSAIPRDACTPALRQAITLTQATALIGAKRYEQAITPLRAYLSAADLGPEAGKASAQLAVALAHLSRWDEVEVELRRLIDRYRGHDAFLPAVKYLAESAAVDNRSVLARELFQLLAESERQEYAAAGLSGLAWLDFKADQSDSSAQLFDRLLRQYPQSPLAAEAAMMRGRALEKLEQWDGALAMYHLLAERFPQSPHAPDALLSAGRLHDQLLQDDEAAEVLRQLLEKYPDYQHRDGALYQYAWVLSDLGQDEQADAAFRRVHDQFPESRYWGDATYRLAERAAVAADFAQAAELAAKILANPEAGGIRGHAYYLQGQLAAKQGQWESVGEPMHKLIDQFPTSPLVLTARYWIAEAHFRREEFSEAAEALATLEQQTRGRTDPWLAMVTLRRCQVLAHLKQWPEALEVAASLSQRFPGFDKQYEADYIRGRCLTALGRLEEARGAFQAVVESPTGSQAETAAMAQWMIGETYFMQKEFATAVRAYLRVEALYRFPEWQAAALLQAGKCFEMQGAWEDAVHSYAQLLKDFGQTTHHEEATRRLRVAQQRATMSRR